MAENMPHTECLRVCVRVHVYKYERESRGKEGGENFSKFNLFSFGGARRRCSFNFNLRKFDNLCTEITRLNLSRASS